jgi:hypothetical protein
MNQNNTSGHRHSQKILSINLLSNNDDDNNNVKKEDKEKEDNDNLIQTQYATPLAQTDTTLIDINQKIFTTLTENLLGSVMLK